MKILNIYETGLKKTAEAAVQVLSNGGLVIAPSDTVYGVLVDVSNEKAVQRLIKFKNRPIGKSISVFMADFQMLKQYAKIPKERDKILHELLPGPFTIVLLSEHKTSKLLESEKGTLGVRIIDFPFISEVVRLFGRPTSATSANLSGKPAVHSINALMNQLHESKKDLIDLVVDAGQLPRNKPSTVIDLTASTVKILRQGDIVWSNEQTFESKSESQTKKAAQFILEKYITPSVGVKPVVVILKGELGAGKTVFVKGIAEKLGVANVISPTFTIYYEYELDKSLIKTLYHFDLYNIEDPEEYKYLGIENYLNPRTLLFFEWGEKAGDILQTLKGKAKIIFVELSYTSQTTRQIKLFE